MSLRHQRVRELLKREIGEILRRDFPLEQNGMLSVNEVAVANDLKSAKVYVGVIGSNEQKKSASALLKKHRGRIQGSLGHSVILKYTPLLQFFLDDSIERGNRVLEIIDELDDSNPPE